MPRGVKRTPESIDSQVAEIQSKIELYQSRITELNTKKKSLLASKEKAEKEALYQLVKQSGQSPSDIIKQLSK
ncbi:hypothetical protein [Marasmitruncus massiliensis]|uniref:hypothetical protein n=1 Tax=Marasmitruncus massiliensis TaxID=1944642 RepID=UPI000C79B329|nr:hypothetical protein [Marasmitruncus massiliensis]MBE6906453.1 hypothetical protein [Oscillospiraceae bacterium]